MYSLTVRCGLRTAHREYSQAPTVQELKDDDSLRAELGYGDNCRVMVDGVEQAGFITVTARSVTIETAANQKAIARAR